MHFIYSSVACVEQRSIVSPNWEPDPCMIEWVDLLIDRQDLRASLAMLNAFPSPSING